MTKREEIIAQAQFIVDTKSTIRSAAKRFGISRTNLHIHVTEKLEEINPMLYKEVRKVLDKNKAERHIRGGLATREKFRKLKGN